ncbi:MAG: 4-(cytidine 5'-diphospho)-2-C-methyl-D-erythritol kinase [Ruminococcus sp.]|nr:4-(cytidine 5'-diphospho)-2-C-methyl-D-erythritol kinase [Ruminococcus sp.]
MRVKTAAKINLTLDVTGKLPNGYHTIESVFQTVGLYDEISVELIEKGIDLSCEIPKQFAASDPIPCDERNIAYKAAKLFFEENDMECGCRIHIKKEIPSQAGMGGGSTDAAAVLYCLGKLTGKKVSKPEKLGADVPFFLTGGTAYVEGIGEKITQIADYSGEILVIAKGEGGVSTAQAYGKIDSLIAPKHPETQKLVKTIESSPSTAFSYFGNIFEQAVELAEVDEIKAIMLKNGSLSAVMTGSGSAVFGLFNSEQQAEICSTKLRNNGYFSCVCETVPESFIILEE